MLAVRYVKVKAQPRRASFSTEQPRSVTPGAVHQL